MSAAELIERYGIDPMVGRWISADIERAIECVRIAAEYRQKTRDNASNEWVYIRNQYEMMARQYMGEARAKGWLVSKVIDDIVRAEEARANEMALNRAAAFLTLACGDETCSDCDRPLWHHITIKDKGTLCPFGRQFWQLARALGASYGVADSQGWRDLISVLAQRA